MKIRTPKATESVSQKTTGQTPINEFPIVGIGASAGGLEALELFFGNLPKDTGMAFVVIQHLDPNYVGIMPELLQRITPLKVMQATDNLKVKPNSVYVIPPNKSLSILNRTLHLFDPVESRGLRLPVDIFFRSLADDQLDKSIGIILSGMGSDGSLGVKAIKEKKGIVLVQTPASAKFESMPQSAIATVVADIVALAEELPAKLISFLKYIPIVNMDYNIDSKYKSNLAKIVILIRDQTGHDFSLYKKSTLFRRIERRKGIHQIDDIRNYVRFLQENPVEVGILFEELMIGVTSFFRDTQVWEKLKTGIFPELFRELPPGYIVRAWVPGCSTGEEAYSLAITFCEALEKDTNHRNLTLQVFATDLDKNAIEKARKGIYAKGIANDVSSERLTRFFKAEDDGYRVSTNIREMIVFASQDVIKDPPFTKLDLLTCRNLLIYLEPELQTKLISLFNYCLNPGGMMVLGTAESLGSNTEGFEVLNSKLKIYRQISTPSLRQLTEFPSSFRHVKPVATESAKLQKSEGGIQTDTDQLLLLRYIPASILINETGDIIYMTGRIGKYLELVAGKANLNIHSLAREGLRSAISGAIRKVKQNPAPVILQNLKIGTNGGTRLVNVTVQIVERPDSIKGRILIVFADLPASVEIEKSTKTEEQRSTHLQKALKIELQHTQEELQSIREEMQTSQEELKSTNEELQSTNEELQSTNEELTTSKEEMQSMNEELHTVNVELQSKIIDYLRANDDMKNLLNSTEIATLFLDKELRIRRYTDNVVNIIKIRVSDLGRPFTDLVTDLQYPEFGAHALQVLKTLVFVETLITTVDKRWFNVRIMPYRTLHDHIDGLVITFIDTTLAKKAEIASAISETHYRRLFESAKDGILILDADTGMIVDVNPFLIELLGYSKEQFIKKAIWQIGIFKDIVANKEKFLELQQKGIVRYENLPLETADGRRINVEFISNVYLVAEVKVIQCFIREFL